MFTPTLALVLCLSAPSSLKIPNNDALYLPYSSNLESFTIKFWAKILYDNTNTYLVSDGATWKWKRSGANYVIDFNGTVLQTNVAVSFNTWDYYAISIYSEHDSGIGRVMASKNSAVLLDASSQVVSKFNSINGIYICYSCGFISDFLIVPAFADLDLGVEVFMK
jgi:hypothetical protein